MSYAPYPAYKDSGVPWLGQVPEGWETLAIKRVSAIHNGSTPKSGEAEFWDGEILWATPDDLGKSFGKTLSDTKRKITPAGFASCGVHLVPVGSSILSTRAPIGHLAIAGGEMCFNQGCRGLVPSESLDSDFLYYVLLAANEELKIRGQGTTFIELGADQLASLPVVKPPIEEQTAIADFLDRKTAEIDDLIAKKEELLRLLAEQRTALITHAVTKGLNPNAPMKPSGVVWFDQVPTHWQVRRLKDVGTLTGGAGFPHDFQNVQGEELYFYKVGDLAKSEDGIHLTSAPHTIDRETAAKLRATVIPPDAILYAKIGAALLLNRRRISTANCCIDNNMTAWIVDPSKVLPLWGFYWMSTVDFGEHTNPGAVPSLSEGYQSILPITLPPLEEQQSIVDQLTSETKAIDQTAQKTREAIERLREYRTALITNAVTGKIKVA